MAYHDHDRSSSRRGPSDDYSPSSSGNATPTASAPASYLGGFVGGFGGLVRRFSDMTSAQQGQKDGGALPHGNSPLSWPQHLMNNGITGVYNPPSNHSVHRTPSPMTMAVPPPLEALELKGFRDDTTQAARLLTPAVAEEIRIMVPERQRIVDEWNLVYSLDQDGASLGTLYQKCDGYDGTRASFVLVVKDTEGGVSNPKSLTSGSLRQPCGFERVNGLTFHLCSYSVPISPSLHVHKHTTSATASVSSGGPPSLTPSLPPSRLRPQKTPLTSLASPPSAVPHAPPSQNHNPLRRLHQKKT